METIKFKVKKGLSITIIIMYFFALLSIFFPLLNWITQYKTTPFDVESILWRDANFAFMFFFVLIYFLSHIWDYLNFKKIEKKWGVVDSLSIEIPKTELKTIHKKWNKIIIRTKEQEYRISNIYFADIKSAIKLTPYGEIENLKLYQQPSFYGLAFTLLFLLGPLLLMTNSFEDKYDIKYAIPFLKIQTIQIKATLFENKNVFTSSYPKFDQRDYIILIDSLKVRISAPQKFYIADKVFNKPALKLLQKGNSVNIKIRTEDYEKFIKTGKFDKNLRFYELEANGEILYQKRGLKEDFETANF